MVAISLYRGNLHRVPEVPRRWRMPPRMISVGEFRALLERRSRALARLQPSEAAIDAPGDAEESRIPTGEKEEGMGESGCTKPGQLLVSLSSADVMTDKLEGAAVAGVEAIDADEAGIAPSCSDALKSKVSEKNTVEESKSVNFVADGGKSDKIEAIIPLGDNANEQRKRDLEKKLDVLNEKKHHLVQMLKQILNAEEEMKKRSNIHMSSVRASCPSLTDPATENGPSIKIATPRMTVEVNFGESEELPSHGAQGRYPNNIQSPSPSSASPFNKPVHGFFHNSANTSRGISASTSHGSMTASPSRFAPHGHSGHGTNQNMVSISGTPFHASSPSPVGSGGASSVFRDSRLTSP